MNFSNIHFGKDLNFITIKDVELFFSEKRVENDQIEFKSVNSAADVDDQFAKIQKSVCSFLNSSGGLVIWGAPKGKPVSGKREKAFQGELTFFNQVLEKDYLISKISDAIIPLPNNIRVNILSDQDKCIVVLEIDASDYSPHQFTNIYYMRIDGQNKPAPHHYIEALFKKVKYPNIEAYIEINSYQRTPTNTCYIDLSLYFFNWSPLQNEERLSFRVLTNGVFEAYKISSSTLHYASAGREYFKENVKDVFYYSEPMSEDLRIEVNANSSPKLNEIYVLVKFGGRYSPRKMCEYYIDISEDDSISPEQRLKVERENLLSKDFDDELGHTRASTIKKLIKR